MDVGDHDKLDLPVYGEKERHANFVSNLIVGTTNATRRGVESDADILEHAHQIAEPKYDEIHPVSALIEARDALQRAARVVEEAIALKTGTKPYVPELTGHYKYNTDAWPAPPGVESRS